MEKSNKSPPAVSRSDGAMLLLPPVVVLSSWRMKSSPTLRDIYLNRVISSVFDKGFKCKHPTHCDSNVQLSSLPAVGTFVSRQLYSYAIRKLLCVTHQTVHLVATLCSERWRGKSKRMMTQLCVQWPFVCTWTTGKSVPTPLKRRGNLFTFSYSSYAKYQRWHRESLHEDTVSVDLV